MAPQESLTLGVKVSEPQRRRISFSMLVCLVLIAGPMAFALAAVKASWLVYIPLAICMAAIVAGNYHKKLRVQIWAWVALFVAACTGGGFEYYQWRNTPEQQAVIAAQEEKRRQEQALTPAKEAEKAKIKAILSEDGVRTGAPTHFKVAYTNGPLTVDNDLVKATIELKVFHQTHEAVASFPLRKVNGYWRLGCEFLATTTQGGTQKVWLSWQEPLPVTGSTTLIYEFVAQHGHCPAGFGPINYSLG